MARRTEIAQPAPRGFDRRGSGHGMLEAGRVANRWMVALRHVLVVLVGKLPGYTSPLRPTSLRTVAMALLTATNLHHA